MLQKMLCVLQSVGIDPLPITHPDHQKKRHKDWPKVRAKHLKDFPACCVSGLKSDLDVHHIVPFHVDPSKELDPANLRTISRPYHFLFGHCCDWQCWNVDFDIFVRDFRRDLIFNKRKADMRLKMFLRTMEQK